MSTRQGEKAKGRDALAGAGVYGDGGHGTGLQAHPNGYGHRGDLPGREQPWLTASRMC